jgi:hypothetical protein
LLSDAVGDVPIFNAILNATLSRYCRATPIRSNKSLQSK